MGGRDDDLTDLASDLAKDPELADALEALANAADRAPPRSGSEFKNPLAGFIDRDRITPKLPPEPTSGRISAPPQTSPSGEPAPSPPTPMQGFGTPPASRRTSSVRAFVAQPFPLPRAAAAQPVSQRPSASARAEGAPAAQPLTYQASPQPIPPAARSDRGSGAIPGVVRLYDDRDRDTPTTRFVKGSSPDSPLMAMDSDVEDLASSDEGGSDESASSADSSDETRKDSVTLPGADASRERGRQGPSALRTPADSSSSGEATAQGADGLTALSSVNEAQDVGDDEKRPRAWLLAVAALVAAAATLALLIVFRPIQGASPGGASASAPTGGSAAGAPATVPAPKTAEAPVAAPTPAPSPTPVAPEASAPAVASVTASAAAPVAAPVAAVTVAAAVPSAPAPWSTTRPATPLTGHLPKAPPTGTAAKPGTTAAPKPTVGPIFVIEN